ncbi:unnamed protein product [Nesidiocoris tenuis]|uniref:Uncharacterized protein n=1 Tax=Nesidiocoris tenuis TaxID=355587 RepID=A0A6H5FYM2_9HEMI|nr:unnamed protein product [Nesidiocoris tenuis]
MRAEKRQLKTSISGRKISLSVNYSIQGRLLAGAEEHVHPLAKMRKKNRRSQYFHLLCKYGSKKRKKKANPESTILIENSPHSSNSLKQGPACTRSTLLRTPLS